MVVRDLNPGPSDYKSAPLITQPHCLSLEYQTNRPFYFQGSSCHIDRGCKHEAKLIQCLYGGIRNPILNNFRNVTLKGQCHEKFYHF